MTRREQKEAIDVIERMNDLKFIAEFRSARLVELERKRLNLSFGGPRWQQIAVARAIQSRVVRAA